MEALIVILRMIWGDRRGQGLAEYALILALIAAVAIALLTLLGQQISGVLNTLQAAI